MHTNLYRGDADINGLYLFACLYGTRRAISANSNCFVNVLTTAVVTDCKLRIVFCVNANQNAGKFAPRLRTFPGLKLKCVCLNGSQIM